MNKEFTLCYLSSDFYRKYDSFYFPEIEEKDGRPYLVFLIKIDGNIFAIPFRTNIRHSYCYKFKNTTRETQSVTGLDFTKAVVINNEKYIGDSATIDPKEYVELSNKHFFIRQKFASYVKGYYEYISGKSNEFIAKKYQFSTLKYFHKELGV